MPTNKLTDADLDRLETACRGAKQALKARLLPDITLAAMSYSEFVPPGTVLALLARLRRAEAALGAYEPIVRGVVTLPHPASDVRDDNFVLVQCRVSLLRQAQQALAAQEAADADH